SYAKTSERCYLLSSSTDSASESRFAQPFHLFWRANAFWTFPFAAGWYLHDGQDSKRNQVAPGLSGGVAASCRRAELDRRSRRPVCRATAALAARSAARRRASSS